MSAKMNNNNEVLVCFFVVFFLIAFVAGEAIYFPGHGELLYSAAGLTHLGWVSFKILAVSAVISLVCGNILCLFGDSNPNP